MLDTLPFGGAVAERGQTIGTYTWELFDGDIDEYRERYGKHDGDIRFHEKYKPISRKSFTNTIMNGGWSCTWECLIGNGTSSSGQTLTYFNNANGYLGIGDGNQTTLSGTVTTTTSSAALTFTSSQALNVGANGDWLIFVGDSSIGVYRVLSGATTSYTLASNYGGTGASGMTCIKLTQILATQTDLQSSSNKVRQVMDATYPSHTDGTTSGAAACVFKATFPTGAGNFSTGIYECGLFNGSSGGRMYNRAVQSLGTKTSSNTAALTLTVTNT